MKHLFLIFLAVTNLSIPATFGQTGSRLLEQSIIDAQQQWRLESPAITTIPKNKTVVPVYTAETIAEHPALLESAIIQALNSDRIDLLQSLTDIYRKQNYADKIVLTRAEAALARWQGNYAEAITLYRQLRQQHPHDERILLDSAATLFEDKQWKKSQELFEKAKHMPDIPPIVQQHISQYQAQIEKQQNWKFSGSLNISHHANINDAPPAYCTPLGCTTDKSEDALGLVYSFSAEKNTPLSGHQNLFLRANGYGRNYYFDNKSQYDAAYGRIYGGWRYQSGRDTFNIAPFYQWQLAGSNEFPDQPVQARHLKMKMLAHAVGLHAHWTHRFSPRLQSHLFAESHHQSHRITERQPENNGVYHHIAFAFDFQALPNHGISIGLDGNSFRPSQSHINGKLNNAAYTRHGFNLGWDAVWPQLGHLNTRIQVSHAKRRYHGSSLNTDFIHQARHDREARYSLFLAHPRLQYHGFRPQLIWEKQHIHSSHQWAVRKQQQWRLEINKTF